MNVDVPVASVSQTAFACPHCGAYAKQRWANVMGDRIGGEVPVPFVG
jgi:hypothetical protein